MGGRKIIMYKGKPITKVCRIQIFKPQIAGKGTNPEMGEKADVRAIANADRILPVELPHCGRIPPCLVWTEVSAFYAGTQMQIFEKQSFKCQPVPCK